MPTFWRVFIINGCWILSKAFSASIEMIIWFFFNWLVLHWITLIDFLNVEPVLYSKDKLHFVVVYILYIYIYFGCAGSLLCQAGFLVAAHRLLNFGMWTLSCSMHVGSSSLTRDWTQVPCIVSAESSPLHHQGSPCHGILSFLCVVGFNFLICWWFLYLCSWRIFVYGVFSLVLSLSCLVSG